MTYTIDLLCFLPLAFKCLLGMQHGRCQKCLYIIVYFWKESEQSLLALQATLHNTKLLLLCPIQNDVNFHRITMPGAFANISYHLLGPLQVLVLYKPCIWSSRLAYRIKRGQITSPPTHALSEKGCKLRHCHPQKNTVAHTSPSHVTKHNQIMRTGTLVGYALEKQAPHSF